jgi:chromosome segregation ATPase
MQVKTLIADKSTSHLLPRCRVLVPLCSCALMLLFAGCLGSKGRRQTGWQTDASAGLDSTGQNQPTAVESAIELSDKYAQLSEEAATLRQQKQNLVSENQKLKDDLQACNSRLEQTEKDLEQAKDLMTEMRVELNNWKENVLGFREEMRDAEKAQLEALLKILKLLGAEPTATQSAAPVTTEERK